MTKMTAIPKVIAVGPFEYSITFDELTRLRAQEEEKALLLGRSNHDALEIVIDSRLVVGAQRETLLHELLHVVNNINGLTDEYGKDKEELIVRRISPILLDLLRRNPELVAYLTAL